MRRLALAALLLAASPAGFDEFQVFDGRITAPGSVDLNLHYNLGRRGRLGDGAPRNGMLLEAEVGYATTPWHEVALYLPAAREFSGGTYGGGFKLRNTLVLPNAGEGPVAAGLDVEIRHQPYRFSSADWAMTLRPIIDLRRGAWQLILNPAVEFPLGRDGPSFAPAVRTVRQVAGQVWLGLEHHMDFGRLSRPEAPRGQAHQLFLTADLRWSDRIGLEIGLGRGLTRASDRWAGKAILSVEF